MASRRVGLRVGTGGATADIMVRKMKVRVDSESWQQEKSKIHHGYGLTNHQLLEARRRPAGEDKIHVRVFGVCGRLGVGSTAKTNCRIYF